MTLDRLTAASAVLLCFLLAPLPARGQERGPRVSVVPGVGSAAPADAAVASDQPAELTREQLRNVLEQYPPSLPQVLRLDPTLLANPEYLALYPALATFLSQHAEVAHNPSYFLGSPNFNGRFYQDSRSQAMDTMKDVLGAAMFLMGFSLVVILAAAAVRMLVEHRRWLRVSKIQTDAHSKLLDRLTSNEDLLAYIQSPAGRQFLEAAPFPVTAPRQALSAPVNRILWSVQAGVVLALGGTGLWYARQFVAEEVGQPLAVMGSLITFLGAGFVLSSLVAYGLSKMLGLFEPPALRPHA